MKQLHFLFILFLISINTYAQNPFEQYNYKPKVATLSQGEYNEFHDQDTLVQIGSVILNTKTQEIVAFVKKDTLYSEATLEPDIVSRWLSPDPLAEKYTSWSPYHYTYNNPIKFIDPDGREIWIYYKDDNDKMQKVQYSANMKGIGNTFADNIISSLNSINTSKAGNSVISALVNTKDKFDYKNELAKNKEGETVEALQYVPNSSGGGGTIRAGALMNMSNQGGITRSVAHESFHGYQDLNNKFENGHHVGLEVEAYIFAGAMYANYLNDNGENNMTIEAGLLEYHAGNFNYSMDMIDLTNNFDQKNFNNKVENFKTQYKKGKQYKNTPIKKYDDTVIRMLYPLLKK
ncbi:hypothetical protein MY04_3212 [Flammeovirga sp. MY04]|uniref:hypothetical protein n=1 Tax=Flammeovirga sp. MY04 TaxID=1191459 RepID=UPI00080612A8|nr:hypothetical protein [Flammeovirga sp. MY04]ANQ50577.1 hypothetical protein MY04_3212 [Flammeovirga sp. MY04]